MVHFIQSSCHTSMLFIYVDRAMLFYLIPHLLLCLFHEIVSVVLSPTSSFHKSGRPEAVDCVRSIDIASNSFVSVCDASNHDNYLRTPFPLLLPWCRWRCRCWWLFGDAHVTSSSICLLYIRFLVLTRSDNALCEGAMRWRLGDIWAICHCLLSAVGLWKMPPIVWD